MKNKEVSIIANTGIQLLRIPNIRLDFDKQVIKKLSFIECELGEGEYALDQVYYFSEEDLYLSKSDLQHFFELNDIELFTLMSLPKGEFNVEALRGFGKDTEELININSLQKNINHLRKLNNKEVDNPLDLIVNNWLPIPFFEDQGLSSYSSPNNWTRIKIIPRSSDNKGLTVDLLLAIDTDTQGRSEDEAPIDFNEPSRSYSFCGMSSDFLELIVDQTELNRHQNYTIPNIIFQYWERTAEWSQERLLQIFHGDNMDISSISSGKRMTFAAYYMYMLNYLYALDILPKLKLCSAKTEPILVNLILDVGNSRSFGLLAEDPLAESFSNSEALELTELCSGKQSNKPFDMRMAFRREDFGHYEKPYGKQFIWPSIVSIGDEAQTYIYRDTDSYESIEGSNTYHSSPKRYLWDASMRTQQWEFARLPNESVESRYVSMLGITPPQFLSDGTFTCDPEEGTKTCFCNFSRRSLMTLSFLEILLQANMQINSSEFRTSHGQRDTRRKIGKIILTCPTAMTKSEQLALRQSAQEAAVVLHRYRTETYNEPYEQHKMSAVCEILPDVRDFSLPDTEASERRSWNFDEASCSQMVYIYSELKRFLGNSKEFFDLYGHIRKDIPILDPSKNEKTLTVGSLDIGAGTTDLIICNYSSSGSDTITPYPLYWDSFHFSGDDLMKALITQIIIEDYQSEKMNAYAGVITNKLRSMGVSNISTLIHDFFDDTSSQTCLDRKMRKDFNVQFSIPLIYKMLDLLQKGEDKCSIPFDDIFDENRPNDSLLDYFAKHFGFRLEDVVWEYQAEHLNQIVRQVFEPYLRKWSAVFNAYGCDIVLLSGRPTSLPIVQDLMTRLYSVAPNRLISMNNYRVGSWYPGADSIGYFGDRKSMVAVGALISHLATLGKLPVFKMNPSYLKKRITSTADYIGFINSKSGEMAEAFLTPEINHTRISISSFPMYIGCKQMNIQGYPERLLYALDFNDEYIRSTIVNQRGELEGADMADAIEDVKHRIRTRMPLTISISRDYRDSKELLNIESIVNSEREEIASRIIKLSAQSIVEDNNDWLDSGRFILRIGLNSK